MRDELDEALCKKYPKIFKNRDGSIMDTCMAWGFECDSGWFDIIDILCHEIQHHIDWKYKDLPDEERDLIQVVADQVKEIMRANPNAIGVNDNWNESVKVLRLDLDQDKLRALGISSQTVMRAANNEMIADVSRVTRRRIQRFWARSVSGARDLVTCSDEHTEIAQAIIGKDMTAIKKSVEGHLGHLRVNMQEIVASMAPFFGEQG